MVSQLDGKRQGRALEHMLGMADGIDVTGYKGRWTTVAVALVAAGIAVVVSLVAMGCGSTGSTSSPIPPRAVIKVTSWLVDVATRYQLDATDSTDPRNDTLSFTWTVIHPTSQAVFDDHCEDVPAEICTKNDDDKCADDPSVNCVINADCATGICRTNSGKISSECSTGKCLVAKGRQSPIASFIADVPGPYTVRLLAESSRANDVDTIVLDTYPSLFVLGSLFAFGGTQGGMIAEFADAASFAADATRGVASPATGNILLAVPGAGLVREFDYRDGSVVGTFGETATFNSAPVALAFDASGRLFVADSDGTVQIYDGNSGLYVKTFGDVANGSQRVTAIAFSPATGDLLIVDGRAGEGIRSYDAASGALLGELGQTGSAVGQAIDLAFSDDGTNALLVADATGDVIRCASNGTACGSFGSAASALSAGGPTAIAVNPSDAATNAKVVVADAVLGGIVGCSGDGATCVMFGDTGGLTSAYADVLFAPPAVPTTTTTTVSTTSTTVTTTTTTTTVPPL